MLPPPGGCHCAGYCCPLRNLVCNLCMCLRSGPRKHRLNSFCFFLFWLAGIQSSLKSCMHPVPHQIKLSTRPHKEKQRSRTAEFSHSSEPAAEVDEGQERRVTCATDVQETKSNRRIVFTV